MLSLHKPQGARRAVRYGPRAAARSLLAQGQEFGPSGGRTRRLSLPNSGAAESMGNADELPPAATRAAEDRVTRRRSHTIDVGDVSALRRLRCGSGALYPLKTGAEKSKSRRRVENRPEVQRLGGLAHTLGLLSCQRHHESVTMAILSRSHGVTAGRFAPSSAEAWNAPREAQRVHVCARRRARLRAAGCPPARIWRTLCPRVPGGCAVCCASRRVGVGAPDGHQQRHTSRAASAGPGCICSGISHGAIGTADRHRLSIHATRWILSPRGCGRALRRRRD